ncbi:MAG: flavin reductase family protein [Nitriliruptorales bacterium]|nr:flavin reductase family protein [Nitriliruptorales bacterium]
MAELTEDRFRAVMSRFATGVTVMTSCGEGLPHGMTANAVASLSLDPPLVLVCVERGTVMEEMVETSGVFALSFLPAGRKDLSEHFADPGRPVGDEQFEPVTTRTATSGAPVLDGAVGWVDCEVWATYDGGDHVIVVGQVVDLGRDSDEHALVYFRSAYGSVHPDEPFPPGR